jgi:dynein heavy chain 1
MKSGSVVEADKSIQSQVHIAQFPEGSAYESLHSIISKGMAPYFKSYVKESGRADR